MIGLLTGLGYVFGFILALIISVALVVLICVLIGAAIRQLRDTDFTSIQTGPWRDVATFLAILVGIVTAVTGLTHTLGFMFVKTGLASLVTTLDTIWWVVILVVFSILAASFRFGTIWMAPTWTWLTGVLKSWTTTQPMKGIGIGVILSGFYWVLLYGGYHYLANWIVANSSASYRGAWLIVTVLGLPTIASFFILYKATGMPETSEDVRKGMKVLYISTLLFFGYWYWDSPDQFFDTATGHSQFWVDEVEEKVYYRGGYSPVTGKELKPGTPEDAKKFQQESLTKKIPGVIAVVASEMKSVKSSWTSSNSGKMTAVAPAGGDWSPTIQIPLTKAFLINPQEGTIEVMVLGTGQVFSCTHNVPAGTMGDLKGKSIIIRSKDQKKEVIVDIDVE